MIRIAIFASGKGSNASNLCDYFKSHKKFRITLILTDQPDAGVINVAALHAIECIYADKTLRQPGKIIALLREKQIDAIILAGYLRLIPKELIEIYPDRIINIHPALLPGFGGKGMYGMHVHHAVAASGKTETGITIHLVNEKYDEGLVLFQQSVPVNKNDSADDIAAKVHTLEMKYYPAIAEHHFKSQFKD